MSRSVLVWGAGGHARVVADILRLGGSEIAGFLDDVDPSRRGEPFLGAQVLGGRERLAELRAAGLSAAVVAIGANGARMEAATLLRRHGFELWSSIHPSAAIAPTARVGSGTVVAAAAVIGAAASLGEDVIVNTGATVDHNCEVDDGAHLAPGVHLGGWVAVGRSSFLGIGALVADRVRIGAGAVVGAGSLVLHEVPPGVVAYGSPARVIRPLDPLDVRTSPSAR